MPTFQITGPDGKKYNVTGDSAEGALSALQQHVGGGAPSSPPDVGNQPIDASTVFTDEMLFGLPGKASAGINALIRAPFTDKSVGEEYDTLRSQYQNARKQYAQENPVANAAASIGGSVYGGAVTGGAAGNLIGRAAPAVAQALQSSYAGRMAADAGAGAVQGGLSAFGHDQNVGTGAAIGGVVGGLSRPVIDAGSSVLSSLGGLVGVGNQSRANAALTQALTRADQTPDDVFNTLTDAAAAGQPYTVADALGNAGQRMLTGIARSPGNERQTIAETLQARQAGQGRRLQTALTEGFGAPQTAQQTQDALTALRTQQANINYDAARQAAGAVDPTQAIQHADNFLQPGASAVMNPGNNIADDSVEAAVRRARGYLTDGSSILSDFNAAHRAKIELDNMIETGNPSIQRQLIPIRDALDDSLARASDPYANARDTFRQQSQDIEAANTGRDAAMRGRVEDTIPAFQALQRPEQQASYRAGYVDPYIADIQKTAGPMTNRARPLISDATAAEFPAFAAPGQGPQLMDRINREQRMFETMNAALGGSRTADNAADMADMQGFDPSIISAFATGGIKGAALHGLTRGMNAIQGRNSATRDAIAQMLLQGNPTQARAALQGAIDNGTRSGRMRDEVIRALIGGGATAVPRLQSY